MSKTSEIKKGVAAAFGSRKDRVFVVNRHGRRRRFLSRSSALNNLVHVMVQFVFDQRGTATHEGGYERQLEGGVIESNRGELTERYWNAHHRTHRRVLRLLAHQRAVAKWNQRWDAWVSQRAELLKQKPF